MSQNKLRILLLSDVIDRRYDQNGMNIVLMESI